MDFQNLKDWIINNKTIAVMFTLTLCLLGIIFAQNREQPEQKTGLTIGQKSNIQQKEAQDNIVNYNKETTTINEKKVSEITVDIKGAVKFRGVYPSKSNMLVNDVVQLAQPLKNADLDAVNLAAPLQDAMVIYVPYKGEVKEDKFSMYSSHKTSTQGNLKNGNQKIININKDEQSALEEIPGIGPKKAQEIIQYRDSNGGFKSIEEIKEIKGIGEKTFEGLKDYIEI